MAPRSSALLAVAGLVTASEALSFASNTIGVRQFLSAKLQPEATARALVPVEDEWSKQAQLYAECVEEQEKMNSTDSVAACEAAPQAFGRSCDTVVKAVVQGSSGDQDAVHQYLDEVCGQPALSGWKKGYCNWFAQEINKAMTSDSYTNRESMKIGKLCQSFWQRMLQEDQSHRIQEKEDKLADIKANPERSPEVPAAPAAAKEEETSWKNRYAKAASVVAANGTTVKLDHEEIAAPAAPTATVAPTVVLQATNVTQPVAQKTVSVPLPVKNATAATK